MTQDRGDRLDRIETTLERVSQQLDNQVVVNAELRQQVADLRGASEALLQTVNQHQENFMVLVTEIRNIREDIRVTQSQVAEMQSEVRGLQAENRRILNRLEGLEGGQG